MLTRTSVAILTLTSIMVLGACGGSRRQTAYITTPLNDGVSAFRLDTNTGAFKEILGSPYPTGISPTSVCVHPSGEFAYVSNAGENTISLYKVGSTGALTEVTPRTPTGEQPSDLLIDPAGAFLFAVNSASNTIATYSITGSSGALSATTGSSYPTSGFTPIRGSISPSAKFLYVANSGSASISGFSIDASGGLSPVPNSPVSVGNGPNWIATDPGGKFLYVANLLDGTFSGFTVDGSTGALSAISGSPFGVASTGTAITPVSSLVVDASGKYIYVTTLTSSSSVYGFTIDATTGAPAVPISGSPFAAGGSASFITPDSTGKLLFVGNQTSSTISGFKITPSSGALTLVSTTSTGSAPTSMFVVK
ncbi:MAG: beta-propeller fold lactonase family protein [Terriglobales bacterium]